MSIFPTRILLATDGSKEARSGRHRGRRRALPRTPALRCMWRTSEWCPFSWRAIAIQGRSAITASSTSTSKRKSREQLRKLSWRVKVAGGAVAGTHLRMGRVDL